jgi:hypothetical protein
MDTTKLRFAYLNHHFSADLCELYRKVFRKDVNPGYFSYKYNLMHHDRLQCSTVALYDEEIVGFFGCMMQDYKDHTRKITVNLVSVCDFMLLEPFRGKQVFDMLYQHSLERIQEEQFECMFGFQSDQTFKFCQRMGWEEGRSFDRFVLPINEGNLMKIRAKLRGEDKMFDRVEAALKPYVINVNMDQFNRFSDCFSRVYDEAFMKEKSDHDLRFLVRIGEAVLWVKYKRELVAGMIRFLDDFDMEKFREEIVRILKPTGISTLTFHFQRQTREHQLFSHYFEPLKSFKISYIRTYEDGCHIDELALNYMDLDIY